MKTLLVLAFVAASLAANGQVQAATCEVTPLWWSERGNLGSAQLEPLGKFQSTGREGSVVRSFKWPDTGLTITAALEFRFEYSGSKPKRHTITGAIAVSEKERPDDKNVFLLPDASVATMRWAKNWNFRVTKNVFLADRTWMLTLNCWDPKDTKTHN